MRQNAINETNQEKGSIMKHIITTTVLAATSRCQPPLAGDAPRDGGFTQKPMAP